MKKTVCFLLLSFLLALFSFFVAPLRVQGTEETIVVINEIAWMGTKNSANDEWIELKNNSPLPIDLSGWKIQTADQKLKINLKGFISPNGFYLLERTDDTSLPTIMADLIYAGAISNNGSHLLLLDNMNNIVDQANFIAKWTVGNNTTKQTAERSASGWQTSFPPQGTPKQTNSLGAPKPTLASRTSVKNSLPTQEISDNKNVSTDQQTVAKKEDVLASIADTKQPGNPWILFFATLVSTIILSVILLLVKFKQNVRS